MELTVEDYLIDQSGKDWSALLSGWSTVLPSSFTVWLVNRFGDAFLVFEDGSVHMLDVGIGKIERVADSRDHFCDQIDINDNTDLWLLTNLVDRCIANGLVLTHNQCYGYKISPILGGKYVFENVVPIDLSAHYSFLADIFRQTKDLPNGTQVKVIVK